MADTPLVLARSGTFAAQSPAEIGDGGVYVVNDRRSLAARILEASGVDILFVGDADPDRVRDLLTPIVSGPVTTLGTVTVEVTTAAGTFVPGPDDARLVADGLVWITELLQLILEAKRARLDMSSNRRRSEIVEKLRRVRVCHLPGASIVVGGVSVSGHGAPRRAVPIDDERYPTVVSLEALPPDLANVDGVLTVVPALCELLGIGDYQSIVELALERWRPISDAAPTVPDFARMLDLEPDVVTEVLSHVSAPIAALARRVAPVVAYYAGSEAGRALLGQIGDLADEPALLAAVHQLAPDAPDPASVVAAARHGASDGDVRERLGLDYARFNVALKGLGSPYAPIHNVTGHAQAMEHHVQTHREQITTALRARFLGTFRAQAPLDEYLGLRELRAIQPDPAWLDDFDLPTDDLIAGHIATWLAHQGHEPDTTVTLAPLTEIRKHNRTILARTFTDAKPLVEAWTRKRDVTLPQAWAAESAVSDLVEAANATALLDFDRLTPADAIGWLARAGHWPAAMRLSLDRAALDLTESDLVGARDAEEDERRERARRLGVVTLDGEEFDAGRDGYSNIAEHVNATLRDDLLRVGMTSASLLPMPASSASGSGARTAPGMPVRPTRLSKEQTAAIGLVGETVAYAWLARRYPAECSPGAWKSAYCETIGEPPGDDTLGYDFEIVLKTRTVYFEVKATSGTTPAFELSEREVGVARDCVRSSRRQYRVLFITDALDAERRSLFVLPNPMDPTNQQFFRFPGAGLTCTFRVNG